MAKMHTLQELARDLSADMHDVVIGNQLALTVIGTETVSSAQALIRDQGIGEHGISVMWEPLTEITKQLKQRHNGGWGGNPSSMLYDTGDFYNDIQFAVIGKMVSIGTNKDYIKYTEYGTSHMAPRPVFPTALANALSVALPQLNTFYLRRMGGTFRKPSRPLGIF